MGAPLSLLRRGPAEASLRRLQKKIARSAEITPDLVAVVLADACPRYQNPNYASEHSDIRRLINAEAWVNLTMTLISLEIPNWSVRALVRDDGEWSCILARRWPMDWLDLVEQHESLPLAILKAFVAARLSEELQGPDDVKGAPVRSEPPTPCAPFMCDNFR